MSMSWNIFWHKIPNAPISFTVVFFHCYKCRFDSQILPERWLTLQNRKWKHFSEPHMLVLSASIRLFISTTEWMSISLCEIWKNLSAMDLQYKNVIGVLPERNGLHMESWLSTVKRRVRNSYYVSKIHNTFSLLCYQVVSKTPPTPTHHNTTHRSYKKAEMGAGRHRDTAVLEGKGKAAIEKMGCKICLLQKPLCLHFEVHMGKCRE